MKQYDRNPEEDSKPTTMAASMREIAIGMRSIDSSKSSTNGKN